MKFIWNDREFTRVDKPTFGEIEHVEKLTGVEMAEWSRTLNTRAGIFWAVRRVDPELLSWDAMDDISPDDVDIIDEPSDAVVVTDPPVSTSATGSAGRRAAAGSSKSGGRNTTSRSRTTSGSSRGKSTS